MSVTRQIVSTPEAPANTGINQGHFSQAMAVAGTGRTVFIGGTLPIDPHADSVDEDPRTQVGRAYRNLHNVATAAGGSLDDVVFLMVLMTDLAYLPIVNEVQSEYIHEPHPPRSAMQVVALPHGNVELVATMVID